MEPVTFLLCCAVWVLVGFLAQAIEKYELLNPKLYSKGKPTWADYVFVGLLGPLSWVLVGLKRIVRRL